MVAQWAAMQAAVEMPEAEQEVVWAEAARVEAMMAVVIRAVERVADHTERVAKAAMATMEAESMEVEPMEG